MIMSIGNPIGCALGQLLPPLVGTPRESVLVLAIITTVICPIVVIVGNKPPTPPTFSGSKESPRAINTLRAVIGLKTTDDAAMTVRERIDFGVIFMGFSILTAAITAFGSLISQVLVPYGYTSDESGIIGAVLLLSGLLGALITAPLFDRVFTHHLGLTLKGLVPPISACWIGMIWAVKSNGLAGIYVLLIFIGFASFTLLPVSLELACEVTRNPATSSAALWAGANLFSFIFIVSAEPLRAGPNAHPPDHLRSYIILQAVFAAFLVPLVMFVKGVQIRREMDVKLRSIK
ncbi:hypothetical protein FRC02_010194 [Tulasnella sp. 418]|nr:hypothetical protein FRC02_010194 [Tulasnella sp. 418]